MAFNCLNLNDESSYKNWRKHKVSAYENNANTHIVNIKDKHLDQHEINQLSQACQQFNYAIYRLEQPAQSTKKFVRDMGLSLGLQRINGNLCADEDNISSIQVNSTGRHAVYIPYTDKPLTWHTDGYYNKEEETIRAMVLHCVRPAQSGGENLMLDHEMAYIQLRDENPLYIQAFMQADALTIPPNIEKGVEIRAAQSGAVFSMHALSSRLHMRFSARTRNIEWKNDALTQEAVDCMKGLLNENNPYVINYRMQAGEGIIANNVLHNRTAFTDSDTRGETRLLYRARYYDRVQEALNELPPSGV